MPRSKRILVAACLLAGCLFALLLYSFIEVPSIDSGNYALIINSADGERLSEMYRERRYYIPPSSIPQHVRNAFIAIEDRRFYAHHGFDLRGILRAAYRNFGANTVVQGGSTITQQAAKLLLGEHERSIGRKIREMLVTVRLETSLTKEEILGLYLNLAYFGERVYGIEAAARTYFDKTADSLTIGEAALLAALQKAPNRYSPIKNRKRAEARRNLVLTRMQETGLIAEQECRKAKSEPMPAKTHFQRLTGAPYFSEFIRQQLSGKYGESLYRDGFIISSTLYPGLQEIAEETILNGVRRIEARTRPGIEAALVAIDLQTGSIRAMVGGTDFRKTQFNRATMALRQPGSAFKPFVYAAALEKGMSTSDLVLDGPISIPDPEQGGFWSPKNSDWTYYGYVSLRTALALSLNAATARLSQEIGLDRIRDAAVRSGIRTELKLRPSIALGTGEVTLLDLTASYIGLATGKRVQPAAYTRIIDKEGREVEIIETSSERVFHESIVAEMRGLLRAVIESGIAGMALSVPRKVYGKTGTTDDYSDAWFVGFDDRIAVGVWVGRDDHTPIGPGQTGSEAALPIWVDFMKKAGKVNY